MDGALLNQALARHLGPVRGLLGCHALLRPTGGAWVEAGRLGHVLADQAQPALDRFDAAAGGTVLPLQGDRAAWLAVYPCAGPGVEMCLIFTLAEMSPGDLQDRLRTLEDKAGWLLVAAALDRGRQDQDVALGVEIGAAALLDAAQARTRGVLADQWIARLEKALRPDAIAVCWVRSDTPRLAALSGGGLVEQPGRARSGLEALASRAITARSAQAQRRASAETDVTDALAALGAGAALSLPVYEGDPCRAVVTALWLDEAAVLPDPLAADLIAKVLGETLAIQNRARPSLLRQAANWAEGLSGAVFGRRAAKLKLAGVITLVGLATLAVLPGTHRPAFNARIEARDRLIVAAPFDGFLLQVPLQLGDQVAPGDLLVAMEDTDFRLERARLAAELDRLQSEARAAEARRDTVEVLDLTAQAQQAQVQLDLLDDQLARAMLTATAPGLVVGGDGWRRVGGRVRLGETLLEVAAVDSLAILAFVDEDWVADLPQGARATLLLSAYPNRPLPLRLDRITSAAEQVDGVNAFAAWLSLAAAPDLMLMDGMRGIVRIEAGQTNLLLQYTRGLRRWADRTLWRWV